MKRRLISLLCVLSMVGLCLCGCQPRPADPDAYHFQISQQENGTYTIEVSSAEGDQLYVRSRMPRQPECLALTRDLLQIVGDSDDGSRWTVFCHVTAGKRSEAFGNYVAANKTKVAYVDYRSNAYQLFEQDMFDETVYQQATALSGLVVNEHGAPTVEAVLSGERLTVTYPTAAGDVTITMAMPK